MRDLSLRLVINAVTDGLRDGLRRTRQMLGDLRETANNTFNGLSGALGSLGFGFFASDVLAVNREMESLRSQLAGVTGSISKGSIVFEEMLKLATDTPFEIQDITKSFIVLKNFGLEPTKQVMDALTNQASKLGGKAEDLTAIATQLGQAYAKGKLQMEDMSIIAGRGVPIFDLLAQVTGKNASELLDMSEKGTLTRDVIEKLIVKMGELSAGSNARAMETLNGKISVLADSWHKFEDALLQDKSEGFIKNIVTNWSGWLDFLSDKLNDTSGKLAKLDELNRRIATRKQVISFYETDPIKATALGAVTGQSKRGEENRLGADLAERAKLLASIHDENKAKKEAAEAESIALAESKKITADATERAKKAELLAEWTRKYGNNQEKLTAELAKARLELGSDFTPDLEAAIIAKFNTAKNGIADAEKTIIKSRLDAQLSVIKTQQDALKNTHDSELEQLENTYKNKELQLKQQLNTQQITEQDLRDKSLAAEREKTSKELKIKEQFYIEASKLAIAEVQTKAKAAESGGAKFTVDKKDEPLFEKIAAANGGDLAKAQVQFQKETGRGNAIAQQEANDILAIKKDLHAKLEGLKLEAEAKDIEFSTTQLENTKATTEQQKALDAELAQAKKEGALADLDFKRQLADQELELGEITQQQHLQRLKELAAEELALRLRLLEDERKMHPNDPVAQAKISGEQQQLMLKFNADFSGLNFDGIKSEIDKLKEGFATVFQPLENALNQSVNSILTGQQTIANAARNAAQSVVLSYVQQSAQIRLIKIRDWLFEHAGMARLLGDKKRFDLLESAWDAAMWVRKRVRLSLLWAWEISGLAGVEARKHAIKQASELWDDVLWAGKQVKLGAQWLWEVMGFGQGEAAKVVIKAGSETIQTATTVAGVTTRQAVEKTANAESAIGQAWRAAKAAFASVMDVVPFPLNLILAPVAGVAAFAGTMALGSAKGGEYIVKEDGKPYKLHEGESVLPAGVADNFRSAVDFVQNRGLKPVDISATASSTVQSVTDKASATYNTVSSVVSQKLTDATESTNTKETGRGNAIAQQEANDILAIKKDLHAKLEGLKLEAEAKDIEFSTTQLENTKATTEQQKALDAELAQAKKEGALADLDFKRQLADQELELGEITQQQHLQRLKELAAEELALRLKLLEDERKLHPNDPVALAKIDGEQQQLMLKFKADFSGLDFSGVKNSIETLKGLFAPLENALSQSVNGILTGQQTIANAAKNAGSSMLLSYASTFAKERLLQAAQWAWKLSGIKAAAATEKALKNGDVIYAGLLWAKEKALLVGKWAFELAGLSTKEAAKTSIVAVSETTQTGTKVASETIKKGAVVGGEAAQTAAVVAGEGARKSITVGGALMAIGTKAAQAAAGAFSWIMTEVPWPLNLIVAPVAAAGAFMATMAFGGLIPSSKQGLLEVPEDRLQFVHKKETILPEPVANSFRSVVDFVQNHGLKPVDISATASSTVQSVTDKASAIYGTVSSAVSQKLTDTTESINTLASTSKTLVSSTAQSVISSPSLKAAAAVENLKLSGQLKGNWTLPASVSGIAKQAQETATETVKNGRVAEQAARQQSAQPTVVHQETYDNRTVFSPTYHNSLIDTQGAKQFFNTHADHMFTVFKDGTRKGKLGPQGMGVKR